MDLSSHMRKIAEGDKKSFRFIANALGYKMHSTAIKLLGSSHFAGKRGTDLQEEVRRVAVPVGHPLDDLDSVVHTFQHAGV